MLRAIAMDTAEKGKLKEIEGGRGRGREREREREKSERSYSQLGINHSMI